MPKSRRRWGAYCNLSGLLVSVYACLWECVCLNVVICVYAHVCVCTCADACAVCVCICTQMLVWKVDGV
jgi:hypothetical protein